VSDRPAFTDDARALMAACDRLRLEGIVAMRTDSPYRPSQLSEDWLKLHAATGSLRGIVIRSDQQIGGASQGYARAIDLPRGANPTDPALGQQRPDSWSAGYGMISGRSGSGQA
jgi:hypothetical protein